MAAGRTTLGGLILFLWLRVPGIDWAFGPSRITSALNGNKRHDSRVLRRVRPEKKKVRFQGKKEAAARKAQIRHKRGAFIGDLLSQLHRAADEGDLTLAEEVFDLLLCQEGFRVEGQTITSMITAAANCGSIKQAVHWFGRLFDYDLMPDVFIFNSVISAGSKLGNISFAEAAFDDMKRYGLKPTVATYGALIKASAMAGNVSGAELWFSRLQAAGLKPTEITCNLAPWIALMLQVLCTLHYWQVAGNAPRSNQCRSPCLSVVFAQVMSAAAKCGNMVAARHWFQKAKEAGMAGGSVPYSTLIAAAKANGDLGAAEAVYQEFLQANPDLKPTFIMLNALIGAAANNRQPEKAPPLLTIQWP